MKHLFIPDNQVKPGVPLDHLEWIGKYIVDKRPDRIINAGDFADMPSLSFYDKGKKAMEGRRVSADIAAVHHGWDVLNGPIEEYNRQRRKNKHALYLPDKHITLGNHEDRITRACNADAQIDGLLSLDSLKYERYGWKVHPFLEMVELDGIAYSHFFANPYTGKPWGGMIITRLKNIGFTFTMGHVQTKDSGVQFLANGTVRRGLVAGACYLHDEDYKGPQGNHHWRGIIMKHEVADGNYDMMEVSLDYLCRRYEGVPLKEYTPHIIAGDQYDNLVA